MTEREYQYNGRIFRPKPTFQDSNSFFHAIFGETKKISGSSVSCFDRNASFRRRCLLNFLTYFEKTNRPDWLENCLKTKLESSEQDIPIQYAPIVAALENTAILLFMEDDGVPHTVYPYEYSLDSYPWKARNEMKEAVVCVCGKYYSQLEFNRYEGVSSDITTLPSSKQEETELSGKTYPKLSGCAGIRGSLYQIDLLTIFLLNGTGMYKSCRMSTENKTTGKFDDVVFEIPRKKTFMLQAKHRLNRKVTYDELFSLNSKNDDYSIPKYYLSYQSLKNTFDIEKMTVCTNTKLVLPRECTELSILKLESNDFLYVEDVECCRYTLNDSIIPHLIEATQNYKKENLEHSTFDENIFSKVEIEKFLSKFQIVTMYPTAESMSSVIERILVGRNYCSKYESKDCSRYLNDKMIEWYETEKGRYLTQDSLRVFLSEFRSVKFCEKLRNLHIHIQDDTLYNADRKLLFVETSRGYVLNMIKVYCSLFNTKRKCLFLGPKGEDQSQLETVTAFADSGYDTLVACFKTTNTSLARQICHKITRLLSSTSYKKVILITGKGDYLAMLLKERNPDGYAEISEHIKFIDLTPESQNRLLQGVIQFFRASI